MAKQQADDEKALHFGAGHLLKLPGFVDAPAQLKQLLKNDESVREFLETSIQKMMDGTGSQVESENDDASLAH